MFIININDIEQASKLFDFIIYADDTTLSTTLEIVIRNTPNLNADNILNTELKNVNDWLKLNKLSLNLKKCKYMIFHTNRKNVKPLHLMIDETTIERVAEFNFLGLTLDENLSWKSHINNISNRISKSMSILNKLKHFIPIKTKILIYNSLVLSHLNFGILAWGFQSARLTKLQKKIIRILSCRKYIAHTEPIFKELKLLKLEDILKLQELKLYYKCKNDKLAYYLQNLPSEPNTKTHDHATRIQHNIHQPKTNHVYAKYCVRFDVPSVINSSPKAIQYKIDTHSLQGFTRYIKNYILQSYQEICTVVNCYICGVSVSPQRAYYTHNMTTCHHLFVFSICLLYLFFIFIKIQIDLRMMYE